MLSTDFEMALTYLRAGRASDAFAILSRIVDRWPTYAAAQVAYAKALQQLGQPEASFQAWSRAEALVSHSGVVDSGLRSAASAMFAADEPSESVALEPEPQGSPETAEHPDEVIYAELDTEAAQAAPSEPPAEEVPEFTEAPNIDPVSFIPIAAPFEEPAPDDTEEAEWTDGPGAVDAEDSEDPAWEGGYAPESGDGAGSDLELDEPPAEADLDRLIGELETARIVPAEDPASIPAPDLSDDIDDVVSETLARIYATQNQFSEAARVYDRLALENPDRADEYHSKASEMRDRAR